MEYRQGERLSENIFDDITRFERYKETRFLSEEK